ncbi:MAG: hypothetical protein ABI528_03525 [bacterium]
MGIFVITCFKPKPGKDALLLEAVTEHMPVLRKAGLVTERECYAMKGKDGSIIEVFEWKSQEAINEAHKNESVLKLWKKFEESSDYVPYGTTEEAKQVFPGFEPINL